MPNRRFDGRIGTLHRDVRWRTVTAMVAHARQNNPDERLVHRPSRRFSVEWHEASDVEVQW